MSDNISPKKHLGQHFLIDNILIAQILELFFARATNNSVIEIGPGPGALTHDLIEKFKKLTCIEIDQRAAILIERKYDQIKLEIIHHDILEVNFNNLDQKNLNIIGNLPYNISTPILFHLFKYLSKIDLMFFMLQKEVVERITSKPNNKNYGRLSVMCQVFCKAEQFFDIPPDSFDPPPKVDSSIVVLTPYKKNPYGCKDFKKLEDLVRIAFNQRRKTISNNLKGIISKEELEKLGVDPKLRPENLSVENYVDIANAI